jgi:hypothetical protein
MLMLSNIACCPAHAFFSVEIAILEPAKARITKQFPGVSAIGSGLSPRYTGVLHHAEVGSSGLSPLEILGLGVCTAERKAV